MARRIGAADDGTHVALTVGIAVGAYFLVLKPLMDLLGEDPQDKAQIDSQQVMPPTENEFSAQYQPFVDNFNANPSYGTDGSQLTMQQYFEAIKAANDSGQPVLLGGVNIAQIAEQIRDALSPWVLATNSNSVFGAFQPFTSKTEVASVAAYLYYNYGEDLLTKLKGSIFKVGLSPADLATLIKQMNALPD